MALHVLHNPTRVADLLATAAPHDEVLVPEPSTTAMHSAIDTMAGSGIAVAVLASSPNQADGRHEAPVRPIDYEGWVALTEAHQQQVDWR